MTSERSPGTGPPRRPVVGAVVQARMGSERLPGKVLEAVCGRPMLAVVLERAARSRMLDRVVLATTTHARDDALVPVAQALGARVWRGSETDVLARYRAAAEDNGLDVIVRITADCPLIDPTVVDLVVAHFLAQAPAADYGSNTWPRSVPTGLDTEVFTLAALRRSDALAKTAREREHVTLHMKEHPELFRIAPVRVTDRHLDARWTVDEAADLAFVRAVFAALGDRIDVHWRELVDLIERRPELAAINAHVAQRVP